MLMKPKTYLAGCCGMILAVVLASAQLAYGRTAINCHVGSYRLANGSFVDISPTDPDTDLRWRLFDGETGALHRRPNGEWISTYGWTNHKDGRIVRFSSCALGKIDFNGFAGKRIPFDITNVTFKSHGTALAGRLVMPLGKEKVPVVVLIHGSEQDSALTTYYLQRMLPAVGIGVFVYDKRGTGGSGGRYTQVFSLLADDAVQALREARRLAGHRLGRIGLQGGSEGGWVAPLAALRTHVDFVIVAYGLAVNIIDEDQESVELQLRDRGFSATDISEALAVAGAAENLAASGFAHGYRTFDMLRSRYKHAPWYKYVRGDYTWLLLPRSDAELRALGKTLNAWRIPFYYNPMPVLMADQAPQLWIVGGQDFEAPAAVTSQRIKQLISMGKPLTLAYYPNASHQIVLFDTKPDGTRVYTRYAPGYFAMMRDYILNGQLSSAYGNAAITHPMINAGSGHSVPRSKEHRVLKFQAHPQAQSITRRMQ
jgi:uncharacterized protein